MFTILVRINGGDAHPGQPRAGIELHFAE